MGRPMGGRFTQSIGRPVSVNAVTTWLSEGPYWFCSMQSLRSSKKLAWAGATAGSVVFLIAAAFLIQQWQLSRLQSKWAAMKPVVQELDNMQQQIRRYRPWFDDSFRSLSILRQLTEAFPEDGSVSAKSVDIRDLATITCSGSARDSQALLKMRDQLSAAKGVSDVHIDQTRGSSPLQFTFNFHWAEGGGNGN